ncbi:carbon-nitrogen hydrolase family protein [Caulobacter sp. 602-1]|uniref:carbon-nitrogen hydrolase family protein n=1 Tax=Caulobacter sp. 602-1 TaxID=2492472 RepID=UPI000F63AD7C|nr:carbon-nitrogen hydrolase family protein [Caulobacter sp. 602-1]RRN66385.1 carbon-nitrogen hydrolase family protein [Caulobacter sp. 602-1]
MSLTLVTAQFAVSADIDANLAAIERLMRRARHAGADVAHFPEAALSGYAGVDFASFDGFDWARLEAATRRIMALAGELGLWVVIGSAHRLSEGRRPHNCAYVIDAGGALVDRYDKRFCAGDAAGLTGDLAHYTPGDHFAVFEIAGVRCGVLICHDYRYPELYRAYHRLGARLMFHGFHAGGLSDGRFAAMEAGVGAHRLTGGTTLPAITMPAGMIAAASNNNLWISCPNSSAPRSCWPSFFVRPDGVITGALEVETEGLLLSEVELSADLYDSTIAWRDRAIDGVLHSGALVEDPRSKARTAL